MPRRRDRIFADLPILAAALEEAGCTSLISLPICDPVVPTFADAWSVDLRLGLS
jgi:hypothetical protein